MRTSQHQLLAMMNKTLAWKHCQFRRERGGGGRGIKGPAADMRMTLKPWTGLSVDRPTAVCTVIRKQFH